MSVLRPDANPRTANSYAEAQAMSSRRLGFTVTRACPLRCRHCSVSAGPEVRNSTFTREFATRVVDQLPSLREIDVRYLDFTGGEPTLAPHFVSAVAAAGKAVGMTSGMVTAAHWATSAPQADRFITRFDGVDNWDVSTDVYHLEFVPVERVELAFRVLTDRGKVPLIRIAHHEVMTREDAELIDRVHRFAGERMAFQSIGPVGRGAELFSDVPVAVADADLGVCPTTGPLVKATGEVSPCCSSLSYATFPHPLMLGNAFTDSLAEIVTRWRVHPLLQTVRLWGFGVVLGWLREEGVDDTYRRVLRHRACELCVQLLADPELATWATEHASTLDNRVRVAYALAEMFDEHWMDEALRDEAAAVMATAR